MTNHQMLVLAAFIFGTGWFVVTAVIDKGWIGRLAKFVLWAGLIGFAVASWTAV